MNNLALQKTYVQWYDDLLRSLRRAWSYDGNSYDPEDALSEALKNLIETNEIPDQGYLYEGNLDGYLLHVAINKLKKHYRQEKIEEPLDLALEQTEDATTSVGDMDLAFLVDWRERYLLVESFFSPKKRPIIRFIYEAMLNAWLNDDEITDHDLAEKIREELNESVQPSEIQSDRRKFRARFGTLLYILDDVPNGAIDDPDNQSVLARLKKWKLLDPQDITTIHNLAALARAAQYEGSLAWAFLSRLLIWRNGEAFSEAQPRVFEFLNLKQLNNDESHARLRLAQRWMDDRAKQRVLSDLRHRAQGNGAHPLVCGYLLPACWYLKILRSFPENRVIEILGLADRQSIEDTHEIMKDL